MFIYNPQLDSRTVSRIAFGTLQYTVPYGTVRAVDSTVVYHSATTPDLVYWVVTLRYVNPVVLRYDTYDDIIS